MDRSYEDVYVVQEKIHPWFQARRSLFYSLLRRTSSLHGKKILDVGCGAGVFLQHLEKKGCKHLEGLDPSLHLKSKTEGSIKIHKDFPKKKYDIILLLDVLEHIKDDEAMLKQIASHLKPNGLFFLSVPAYQFLWSRHDVMNKHFRRYNKSQVMAKLKKSGFRIQRMTYWNMIVFLPVAFIRLLKLETKSSDLEMGSAFSRGILRLILAIENFLIKIFNFPFGLNIICLARRGNRNES